MCMETREAQEDLGDLGGSRRTKEDPGGPGGPGGIQDDPEDLGGPRRTQENPAGRWRTQRRTWGDHARGHLLVGGPRRRIQEAGLGGKAFGLPLPAPQLLAPLGLLLAPPRRIALLC